MDSFIPGTFTSGFRKVKALASTSVNVKHYKMWTKFK